MSRIPNSSPPSRAAMSVSRIPLRIRSPTDDEHLVAGGVAQAVIDGLEVVEIEEQGRERTRAAGGPSGPPRRARRTVAGWRDRSAGRGRPGSSASPRGPAARRRRAPAARRGPPGGPVRAATAGRCPRRSPPRPSTAFGPNVTSMRSGDHGSGETDQADRPQPRDDDRVRIGESLHGRVGDGGAEQEVRGRGTASRSSRRRRTSRPAPAAA